MRWPNVIRPDRAPSEKLLPLVALLSFALILAACGGASAGGGGAEAAAKQATGGQKVQEGDTVSVHYRGTLDSGEEFDSSRGGEPLTLVVGGGQIIKGFDDAVRGLSTGETAKGHLEPDQAYGQPREGMIFEVPRDQAPEGLTAGNQVQLSNGAPATVLEVTDTAVRIDANHPLAGKALNFEIEVVSVKH